MSALYSSFLLTKSICANILKQTLQTLMDANWHPVLPLVIEGALKLYPNINDSSRKLIDTALCPYSNAKTRSNSLRRARYQRVLQMSHWFINVGLNTMYLSGFVLLKQPMWWPQVQWVDVIPGSTYKPIRIFTRRIFLINIEHLNDS